MSHFHDIALAPEVIAQARGGGIAVCGGSMPPLTTTAASAIADDRSRPDTQVGTHIDLERALHTLADRVAFRAMPMLDS